MPPRRSGEPVDVHLTDEQIAMHALCEIVRVDRSAARWAAENLNGVVGRSVLDTRAAELLQRLARDV